MKLVKTIASAALQLLLVTICIVRTFQDVKLASFIQDKTVHPHFRRVALLEALSPAEPGAAARLQSVTSFGMRFANAESAASSM